MESLWFALVAFMLAAYVVLDGFDLGAGAIHLLVARTPAERSDVLRSIGPVWDGNEVWLIAAGGTLFFAFPSLYAASFSGFYLPLMMVLWLLILRGIAIDFRNHLGSPVWVGFWDVVFSLASLLLAVFFGAALGNVLRGVPFDAEGRFFEPLWTDFLPYGRTGILDAYTILTGLCALAALAQHGALWIALKTEGALQERARRAARRCAWSVASLTALVTLATFALQPRVAASLEAAPWGVVFPALAVGGLAAGLHFLRRGEDRKAFAGSCAYLAGMMASAAFGLHPYVLPAVGDPAGGLTIHSAAAPGYSLGAGLFWWPAGLLLALGYAFVTYRRFAGKVRRDEGGY
jgi:cytochrome bd ubiquinol oxidase subunit II